MTVKKLYEEYHTGHPDGYLKASFGMKLRQFMLQTNAIGHVEHRAGDQMYIDFAGDRLEIVDEATAGIRKVEVFLWRYFHVATTHIARQCGRRRRKI